jgi:hypothetical protein
VPRVSSFELPISASHNHLLRVLPVVGCRSKTPTTGSFSQPFNVLEKLCEPFSHEEIDNIILELHLDKAPDPDGFNNLFLKKAWPTIKEDFYRLCFEFCRHQADLKSINHSFITLIPKKDNP